MTAQLATITPAAHLPTEARSVSTQAMVFDPQTLANMQRMAETMASARITIPKHLAGSPGDCLAIVMQAAQWQMNPFAVAQKTHIVNGALGYEAQLVNAVVSSSPLLASRISYEWEGDWTGVNGKADKSDARAVLVSATLRGEVRPRTLRVSMAQVGEVRNSPLWVSDPRQQLAYLATKRWARLHAPDVMLGVYTVDELEESRERAMGQAEIIPNGQPANGHAASRTDALKAQLAARKAATPQPAPILADGESAEASPDLPLVLTLIRDAGTPEELHGASEMAKRLASEDDKVKARKAFADRQKAMKREAEAEAKAKAQADAEARRREAEEEARLEREAIQAESDGEMNPAAADFFVGEAA